jgi:spermidine/putrescine-binding protein
MKLHSKLWGAIAASMLVASNAMAAELTVYTAVEAEDLKRYAETFNKDHPDITINWVRDSTGIVTAKLLAEKNNPQADVVWGLAATSLLLLKSEGMLEAYAPKGVEKLDPKFVDKSNPPAWVGMDAWVAAVCYNTVEAGKLGLPVPTSWKDLTDPVYKGHLIMPNPNSSGTGFHGRAAREYRALHPFRLEALQAGRGRRDPDRHLVRIPRRQVEGGGRTPGDHRAFRGCRLGYGGHRHRCWYGQSGSGQDPGRLVDQPHRGPA